MKQYIVAGIGTEIGKTMISAILCQKLKADYWKPVQAGNLEFTDSDVIESLTSFEHIRIHPETYRLNQPMSPHAAAKLDGLEISLSAISPPETNNSLIIEMAGGLMVPLNDDETNLDLILQLNLPVILISRYYLGSINHTLLACHLLLQNKIQVAGIVFNGEKNQESKDIILSMTQLNCLGDIPVMNNISPDSIIEMGKNLVDFE